MKKIIAILLMALLIIGTLTACGSKGGSANGGSGNKEVAENLKGDLSGIIDKIYAEKEAAIKVGTTEIDLTNADAVKAYTGLDDASKIEAAAASESMMGSQAYSLVLIRVKDAADTKDVAEAVLNGINPAKWICVQADDLKVAAKDNVVMLMMMQSDFDVTSSEVVEAFKTVAGGSLDVELSK